MYEDLDPRVVGQLVDICRWVADNRVLEDDILLDLCLEHIEEVMELCDLEELGLEDQVKRVIKDFIYIP